MAEGSTMTTMKALSALKIKLNKLNELLEFSQHDKVIELLEESLTERIQQWRENQIRYSKEEIDMRTIHEAYQFLFKNYVGECAKNTVENQRATLR